MKTKQIAILGAGNLGVYLAALCASKGYDTTLCTQKIFDNNTIKVVYDNNKSFEHKIKISNTKDLRVYDCILITYPAHIVHQRLAEYNISAKTLLGWVPGSGDIRKYFSKYTNTIFILNRVPAICRLITQSEVLVSKKPQDLVFATINTDTTTNIWDLLHQLFTNKFLYCDKPELLALTTSNQLLHTARIYNLFKSGLTITCNKLFYGDWTIEDSKILIKMSNDIQSVIHEKFNEYNQFVPSVLDYYEVTTAEALTNKLRGIPSLHAIKLPVLETSTGLYKLDVNSRYVAADFDCGLRTVKATLDKFEQPSTIIDTILAWFDAYIKN